MKTDNIKKEKQVFTLLRRMRESAELTMRQVGALIGVSHVTISQFENGKLELPDFRIEQMVSAYGLTMQDFYKILGHAPAGNPKDDCHAMLNKMNETQLAAIRAVLKEILQACSTENAAQPNSKLSQMQNSKSSQSA